MIAALLLMLCAAEPALKLDRQQLASGRGKLSDAELAKLSKLEPFAGRIAEAKRAQKDEAIAEMGDAFTFELSAGPALPGVAAARLIVAAYQMPLAVGLEAWAVQGGEAVLIGEWAGNEAGSVDDEVTVGADGALTRRHVVQPVLHEFDSEVKIVGTATGRLSPKPQLGPMRYETNQGWYVDEKSKEQLVIAADGKVYYRGTGQKPLQELTVEGDVGSPAFAVRFKDGKKPYALSLDGPRAALRCKAPDGKVQTFTRAAWAR